MDPNIAIPHYPPPQYSDAGWNEVTESYYCDAPSHCLIPQSAQSICDNQCSMSNSLYEPHGCTEDHTDAHVPPGMYLNIYTGDIHGQHVEVPVSFRLTADYDDMIQDQDQDQDGSQPSHAHVPPGMYINIFTGDIHGQNVEVPISFRLTADYDDVIHDQDQDQDGCVGMSQLTLHSEHPPISSYSELSTQMSYYNSLNSTRQSKTLGFSALSTPILATTQESKPLKSPTTPPDWKVSKSSKGETTTLRLSTPPPSPKTSTFEAWVPPIQIKTEERSPSAKSRRKRLSSPSSSTRSSSTESRRSRVLSPSSRSQGVLKTIMMKRAGSERKKQNLACLFCREHKIACGRPPEGSDDPACK